MKILIILLALVVVPCVIGIFQTKRYKKDLQLGLQKEALAVAKEVGVDNPSVSFEYLDATISGIAVSEEARVSVVKKVSELAAPGAVRAKASDALKVYGELNVAKTGKSIMVNGQLEEGT